MGDRSSNPVETAPRVHRDADFKARTGFDNIWTIEDHLKSVPKDRRYAIMNRLDKRGYYRRRSDRARRG